MSQLIPNARAILADAEQILEQVLQDEPQSVEDELNCAKLLLALHKYRKAL